MPIEDQLFSFDLKSTFSTIQESRNIGAVRGSRFYKWQKKGFSRPVRVETKSR